MTAFKRTNTSALAKSALAVSPDALYWKDLSFPITVKEFSAINYIDVASADPYCIAVSSGPKIDIYHQQTLQIWCTLTRFSNCAYGANFRHDGQLLVSGSEEGEVKVFNYLRKQILRIFKGHGGPVHRARFISGLPQVASFSDDKNVILWDLTDESLIATFAEHKDFVRCGASSTASEHVIFSGSYDHTVKMWDTRTNSCVLSVDHGAPVEDVVCYPSGNVFVSSGGNDVSVWDIIGGKVLARLCQHHKAVTALCLASNSQRLMSGSLDRHVKIYDVNTYSVVHSLDFPAPVLAVSVSPEDQTLCVGMISEGQGLLSFQHRKQEACGASTSKKGEHVHNIRNLSNADSVVVTGEKVMARKKTEAVANYDRYLQRYEYTKALTCVISGNIAKDNPHVTVSLFRELIKRRGLKSALAGRKEKGLLPIIKFLVKHVGDPSFSRIIFDVTHCFLDVYEDSLEAMPLVVKHLSALKDILEKQQKLARENMGLMGAIEMFFTACEPAVSESEPMTLLDREALPSNDNSDAKSTTVVDVS